MKYFNFTYPLSLLSPLSYENFCEKLETNDYIHLVGPECDNNLDIEKHINNLTKLFNNKIYNIDQIIFHCPTLPSNELITIDIDGISLQRKKPFNVDFNNLDRIYDKIKNINPIISSKLSYNDIDFERYANKETDYTFNDFQLVPSIIKTKSIINNSKLFYSALINTSEYEAKILSKKFDKICFCSYHLCLTDIKLYPLWDQICNIENKDSNNMTIVTAFIKLKKNRIAKSSGEYDYIESSKKTLGLRQNMVIFISEESMKFVTDYRDSLGLLNKTKIIKIDENDLYMISKYDELCEKTKNNKQPYNNTKYIMAVNSRYQFIERAINTNYYKTDYFTWIDFAGGHIINFKNIKNISYNRKDKIRICWIGRYKKQRFSYNHEVLGGGLFMGHKNTILKYCKLHNNEFTKLMKKGLIINDDKLCFFIFEKYPQLFDFYFSSYSHMLIKA
jgi:hypothetical protein